MNRPKTALLALVLVPLVAAAAAAGENARRRPPPRPQPYWQVIQQTVRMVHDSRVQNLAARHGLQVLDVTWEDTARHWHSTMGPNISDLTIQIQCPRPHRRGRHAYPWYRLACLPVIRHQNFADHSADIPPERIMLLAGNQCGRPLSRLNLRDLLANPRSYLTNPGSWPGPETSLLAPRDSHVLVSAQACFLPLPDNGTAEFNPVIFNYQSAPGRPAVLTILATPEGTSVTVVDNRRDTFQAGAARGQRLFFNRSGQRAVLAGRRLSDSYPRPVYPPPREDWFAINRPPERWPPPPAPTGLNQVLIIQVPLLAPAPPPPPPWLIDDLVGEAAQAAPGVARRERGSDVEEAVVSHGRIEGPFTEIGGLPIRRDPRYPVRVTVQFYLATSNGVVDEGDMSLIAARINEVYTNADFVGSLVVDGPRGRPTEHPDPDPWPVVIDPPPPPPPPIGVVPPAPPPDPELDEPGELPAWWHQYWSDYYRRTGRTPERVLAVIHTLRGADWRPLSQGELAIAAREAEQFLR